MQTLVRQTSRGLIGLRFWSHGTGGFSVGLGAANEQGWLSEGTQWLSSDEERSLADAAVEAADIPREEAEQLAASAVQEWKERGGEEEGKGDFLKGLALVTAIGGGVLLSVAALVALIWLLIQAL